MFKKLQWTGPLLSCVLLTVIASSIQARVFELTPDGPMTIQQAADQAQAGDVIRLTQGVYQQRVVFNKNSGEFGKPITLEGPANAIIDGSKPAELKWEDASFITKGLYRTKLDWRPWYVTADNKSITQMYYKRVKIGSTGNEKKEWPMLFEKGPEGRTLKGAQAVAMVNDDERTLYIRFVDNTNPADKEIRLSPKDPIVLIEGAHRIVIRGISIRDGWCAVYLKDTLGSFVENCKIGPTHHGVMIAENADSCTVRFNDITLNPLAHIDPRGDGRGNWTNWLFTKTHGYWDHFGISFTESTGNNQVHDNYVHSHWGGIEDHSKLADSNDGNRIHHNLVHNIADDGLEPEGSQPNCQWHDNIVYNAICGFRIKPIKRGPMYIYRNIIHSCGEGLRNFSTSPSKPDVYVYHNTTSAFRGAYSSNSVFDDGTKNYHYYNNVMISTNPWSQAKGAKLPNWHGDYNTFIQMGDDMDKWNKGIAILKKQGLDANSQFLAAGSDVFKNQNEMNFELTANSKARNSGANISKLIGKTLPGMDAAVYQSSQTDAGALAYGQAMPKLPRDPDQIKDLPKAGSWPAADAKWRRVLPEDKNHQSTGRPLFIPPEIQRYWDKPNANMKPITKATLTAKQDVAIADTVQLGENLLKNPQFAQHSGSSISGWKLSNSSKTKHTLHVDTEQTPDSVKQSARIDIDGIAGGLGQFYQRIYLKPGKKYRFSGYIKSNPGGIGQYQIKIFKGKQELARLNSVKSNARWQKAIVDITDTSVDKIEIIGRFKQTGQTQGKNIWFADMSLAPVLGSTGTVSQSAVSASPKPAAAQPAVDSSSIKTNDTSLTPQEGNLLKNPVFAAVDSKGAAANWKLVNSSKTHHIAVVDTEDKPEGLGQSIRIKVDGQGGGLGQMLQRVYHKPQGKMQFSCYLKGDIKGVAFVQIKIFEGRKELKRINTPQNGTDWKKVSVTFDNPNINKIEVIARFKQSGYVQGKDIYFADMYLGPASE
ncbi:MAG: right-handed parallel beta-helix repeat-containing protein [Phycisphaeraceae bacterium JB051]